jgi:hypothetical protein
LFKAARRVSAPIVVLRTADQFAAVETIRKSFNGSAPAMLAWDIVRGMQPLNEAGQEAFNDLGVDPIMTTNPTETLGLALKLPPKAVLFLYNLHRVIGNETVSQGVWNVREEFKTDGRTLVLLGPDMPLPAELGADAFAIDDALPTEAQLRAIVVELLAAAGLTDKVADETIAKAVDAVAGLAAFPAEQAVAMSLSPAGIDLEDLWERKRQAIEQAPGLSVWRGGETFDDIGGIENVKAFGRAIIAGSEPPRAVVFIDEIEKAMAGGQGDTSGVSQEMLGTMLSWMQDKNVTGMLLVGPPGAAKSAFSKSLGNTAGVPTIQFDLAGMKGSLVGESGRNLRSALRVVDAVAQNRALVVATCNSLSTLPPELRRRFQFGTFFFDLPTADEREAIWVIYATKLRLAPELRSPRPKDEGWTGAEIRTCCDIARRLNIKLIDAAKYIVPVAKSAAESIQKLREQASGRFISASDSGVYQFTKAAAPRAGTRQFEGD